MSDVVVTRNGSIPWNEIHLFNPAHVIGINNLFRGKGHWAEALDRKFEPFFGDGQHGVEEEEHVGVVVAHPVDVVVVRERALIHPGGPKDLLQTEKYNT